MLSFILWPLGRWNGGSGSHAVGAQPVAEVQPPVGPKLHGAGRRRHDALTSQFAISRLLGDTMSVAEVQPTVGQTEAWAGGG